MESRRKPILKKQVMALASDIMNLGKATGHLACFAFTLELDSCFKLVFFLL